MAEIHINSRDAQGVVQPVSPETVAAIQEAAALLRDVEGAFTSHNAFNWDSLVPMADRLDLAALRSVPAPAAPEGDGKDLTDAEAIAADDRLAVERIATLCHEAGFDNPDGTALGVVYKVLDEVERLRAALRPVPAPAAPEGGEGAVRRCPMCRSVPHVYDNYGAPDWTPAHRTVECKNATCYVSGRVVPMLAWNGAPPIEAAATWENDTELGFRIMADERVRDALMPFLYGDYDMVPAGLLRQLSLASARAVLRPAARSVPPEGR